MYRLLFKTIFILTFICYQNAFSQYASYTVKRGDTLYGIAMKNGMKVSDFLALNDIKDSSKYKLKIGDRLQIEMNDIFTLAYDSKTKSYAMVKVKKQKVDNKPTKNESPVEEKEIVVAKDSTTQNEEKTIAANYSDLYTVVKGDTLYGIAFKHDMKISDFLSLNDIKDSSKYNLQVGERLKIKKTVVVAPSPKPQEKAETVVKNDNDTKQPQNNESKPTTEKIDTYTVAKGDTLYGIAFKHDMKISDFLSLNDIKDSSKYNLQVGERLKIKKTVVVAPSPKPQEKTETVVKNDNDTKQPQNNESKPITSINHNRLVETYTAKSGDTLSEIAEYFGMDMIDIYIINKLDNKYILKVGEKLYVYKREATAYNTKKYTVKSGDTLYSIAKNNNMSIAELLDINSIKDTKKYTLHAGTNIKVYTKGKLPTDKVDNQDDIKATLAAGTQKQDINIRDIPQISLIWPHRGSIVASYGVGKDKIATRGINISGNKGDKIVAADKGVVEYSGAIRGFGNVVIIRHENDYTTSYAHLSSSKLDVGSVVDKGDEIGIIGSSGLVDNSELYFKVSYLGMPINPMIVLPKS